jgi:hypothetical protein
MFKKTHEVTEGERLRNALRHKDTTITISGPTGCWILCNDTAAECSLNVSHIMVAESGDKQDVLTDFIVRAKNGRLG